MLKSIFNFVVSEGVKAVIHTALKTGLALGAKMSLDHAQHYAKILKAALLTSTLMCMLEAEYQEHAQARAFAGYYFEDEAAPAIAEKAAARLPEQIIFDHKNEVQPGLAAEMIALLRELARRVMEGAAPVSELMSMVEAVQRMGIDVMDFMAVGPAFHSHEYAGERAA